MVRSRRANRLSAWAGVVVLLLLAPALLTGCGEDEDGGGGKGGVVAGAGSSSSTTGKTSPEATSDEAEDETEDAEDEDDGVLRGSQTEPEPADEPAATGGECLVGTWQLDNNTFGAMLASAGLPANAGVTASGKATTTFNADGSGTVQYKKWQFVTTIDGAKATVTRNGKDTINYTATDGGDLTIIEKKINSKVATEVMGMKMGAQGHSPETTKATYSCDGDKLEVTSQGHTSLMHRVG